MNNDLISRSALLEDFRNTITERSDTFDWLNMINRQPTAITWGGEKQRQCYIFILGAAARTVRRSR